MGGRIYRACMYCIIEGAPRTLLGVRRGSPRGVRWVEAGSGGGGAPGGARAK